MSDTCNTFWGSHGCDMPAGHDGPHTCGSTDDEGVCSQFELHPGRTLDDDPDDPRGPNGRVRFTNFDPDEWGTWSDWTGFR